MVYRLSSIHLVSAVCAIGLALSVGSVAKAVPLTWTVTGTFNNASALSGTFNYDATTQAASNWNLTGALGFNYTPADSLFKTGQCCTDQTDLIFYTPDGLLTLDFAFKPDLSNAGGTNSIAGGGETKQFTDRPATSFVVTGGNATTNAVTNPVPEPGTSAYLAIAGCLAVAIALRCRRLSLVRP